MADNLGFTNFQDPFSYGDGLDSSYKDLSSPYGQDTVGGALSRIFDPKGYQNWLDYQNKMYERASVNSARAWDLWFDSTATQRRVEDIRKAGLNPWLAVSNNGGGVKAFSESSSNQGGNARANDSKSPLATLLIGVGTILKALLS